MNDSQFSTVEQFSKKYPSFTEGSIRWLLFNRKHNGFDKAVIRLGKRILIDDAAFVACLREKREAA